MDSSSSVEHAKLNACREACRILRETYRDASVIGVGTGSTIKLLIDHCRDFFTGKRLVPSSADTMLHLASIGYTVLLDPAGVDEVDVYIDGADEVSSKLDMVKGRGGAFAREKTLALRSRERIYVVDYTKYTGVDYLYAKPIPVEVLPVSLRYVVRKLGELGYGEPVLRVGSGKDGPVVSDNGNYIVDYKLSKPVRDPLALHNALKLLHGVIETGVFPSELVDMVIVGEPSGVKVLKKKAQ
ncbi:ribose-5-phosphate isomerase [Desulfurococcus mucosus DSM 2162]|uniref:Ribose 5-phosphate isomerase A n=2 Tax=Desulfurococcus mucosus TaxID=2275 RepID=E8R953_DESM0|nr:ribose-5-phosphate isomerase [Desulfurococcus mucosus DSM 2162]